MTALSAAVIVPAIARDRYVNVTNPVILTRPSCVAPYVAAAKTGGKDGADVVAALERDGCIRRLTGTYEFEIDPNQHDDNFVHGTLRLNVDAMQRREPGYKDKDLTGTPPVVIGYAFRSQIDKASK